MTLFQNLQNAGLPVISATEGGDIAMDNMTEEQMDLYRDILLEYFNPTEFAKVQAQRLTQSNAVTYYNSLPAWMRQYTSTEAVDYVNGQIFNGQTAAQVKTTINAQLTDITTANIAQINARLAVVRNLFGSAVDAIIAVRDILKLLTSMVFVLRDLLLAARTDIVNAIARVK